MKFKKMVLTLFVGFAFLFVSSTSAFAEIKAVFVKGKVIYKYGRKWKTLKKNDILRPGTKISTGLRGKAIIKLNRHILTIRRLTMIKIYQSTFTKNRSRTKIGLRRGRIKANVYHNKRIKTIFKVATPVATSSVRGTIEEVGYGPLKGATIRVLRGSVVGQSKHGATKLLTGKLTYHKSRKGYTAGSLLRKIKARSMVNLADNNISGSEGEARDLPFGDEIIDNAEHVGNNILKKILNSTNINIVIKWNSNK